MKILILDTQGEMITDAYRGLLPGVRLRGVEPESTRGSFCHPHGAFCGWLAALPLTTQPGKHEVVFGRIFDCAAGEIAGSDEWMLGLIEEERPNYVSRSWGMWDGDSQRQRMYGRIAYGEWVEKYRALCRRLAISDFGAAGNSDEMDADPDVDFPQCMMPDVSNIIGAAKRGGKPTRWSGDGPGVLNLMWGDKVYSPDMGATWTLWSGTSAATPKACGAAAAMHLGSVGWRAYVRDYATRPSGYQPPHAKWGWGNAEAAWQNFAKLAPAAAQPPGGRLGASSLFERPEYFEFRRVR